MKAAGHIGLADIRHDRGIVATRIDAVGFAHVAIDIHFHAVVLSFVLVEEGSLRARSSPAKRAGKGS